MQNQLIRLYFLSIMREKTYRYALVAAFVVALLLGWHLAQAHRENSQLTTQLNDFFSDNQTLARSVEHYRTLAGESAASVEALRLRTAELERLRSEDAELIRSLRLRIRRVEALTTTAIEGEYEIVAPIVSDTQALADSMPQPTAIKHFEWSDGWATVRGRIEENSVSCEIATIDTLHQIIHRVPRRFLFFRFGTKTLRQEIISSNPHNRIVYAEYIEVAR